jgi:CrcB protein
MKSEAAPGFEPGIRVLQTHALPLGYAAAGGAPGPAPTRDGVGTSRAGRRQFGRAGAGLLIASARVKWWLLFGGGGLGAMLRFALATWVDQRLGPPFPWGTLAVNLSGCFAVGLLATLADEGGWLSPSARLFLVPGVLGGFTTFSTFGLESWRALAEGQPGVAFGNIAASVLGGLVAVVAGVVAGRAL